MLCVVCCGVWLFRVTVSGRRVATAPGDEQQTREKGTNDKGTREPGGQETDGAPRDPT